MKTAIANAMNKSFSKGEALGRKDGAMRWGSLPASCFLNHAEWQGYQAGYTAAHAY